MTAWARPLATGRRPRPGPGPVWPASTISCPRCCPRGRPGRIGVAQAFELARLGGNPRARASPSRLRRGVGHPSHPLVVRRLPFPVSPLGGPGRRDGAHRDHQQGAGPRRPVAIVGARFHLKPKAASSRAAMAEILERYEQAEFHADWDVPAARYGDDVARAAGAHRRQRRIDALQAIFMAAAAGSEGSPPLLGTMVTSSSTRPRFESAITAMAAAASFPDATSCHLVIDPTRATLRNDRRLRRRPPTTPSSPPSSETSAVSPVHSTAPRAPSTSGAASRLFRGTSRLAVWLQGTSDVSGPDARAPPTARSTTTCRGGNSRG